MAARPVAAASSKPTKRPTRTSAATVEPAAARRRKKATAATKGKASAAQKTARTVQGNVLTPVAWGAAQRTDELAKLLGGVTALARALGVSPSQPSRWRSGKESPGPEAARRLIDLDHVVARAMLVWHPEVIPVWLTSANGYLNGQTPLGVLMTRGPAEVLDALDAYEAGGFA